MGSGPQPASSACISLSYLVKCCVDVLGGHTPGAIATEAGSLTLFTMAAFALTRHQAGAAESRVPEAPHAIRQSP
jgi:hypothetical protein